MPFPGPLLFWISRGLVFLNLHLSSCYMECKSKTNNTMKSSVGKYVWVGTLSRNSQMYFWIECLFWAGTHSLSFLTCLLFSPFHRLLKLSTETGNFSWEFFLTLPLSLALDHGLLCFPCSVLNIRSNCLSFSVNSKKGWCVVSYYLAVAKRGGFVLVHLRNGMVPGIELVSEEYWLLLFTLISTCWLLFIAKIMYLN